MGLKSGSFSHIFIDEAGQSTEPEILLPLCMCLTANNLLFSTFLCFFYGLTALLDPLRDGQVILAGDPKQLGPVVMSLLARNAGLGQSMLARFINYPPYQRNSVIFPEHNGYNPKVITHLTRNYRSLPEIVHIYSKLFYHSLLIATVSCTNKKTKIF